MPTIPEAFTIAIQHHRAGRLHETEAICRQILAVDPQHPDAWHLLGVVACQVGRHQAGVEFLQCALSHRPNWPEAHNNLGNAWREQGKLEEAAACFQSALQLKPDFAAAHSNLGIVRINQAKLEEAVACFQRAVQLKPDFAEAYNNLGSTLKGQGKLADATAAYQRALQLRPDLVESQKNLAQISFEQEASNEAAAGLHAEQSSSDLAAAQIKMGNALAEQGKLDEAVAAFQRALRLMPESVAALYNLGTVLLKRKKLDEAVAFFLRALELKPDLAQAHNNLGTAWIELRNLDEAVASFQRALQLKPDFAEAHNNLGNALADRRQPDEAVQYIQRALQLKPDYADAHNSLGNAFKQLGKLEEAVASYRRALQFRPEFVQAHGNLLLTLQYRTRVTLSELATAHAEYQRMHATPLRTAWRRPENSRDPDRRLRVGLVSRDFGRHPVGYFLIRVLENLDSGQYETVCYSDRVIEDDLTARFQAAATIWRNGSGSSDTELTEQVRADRIDILFDLAGHTARNRLLVFACKPAPIQVTWAGYVGTTGLEAMDYILADRYEIPPEAEPHYCERVLRMPDGYVSYDPPGYAPPVSPLPAMTNGYVTFGSFNNPAKFTSQTIAVWASILDRVSRSRLVLKYSGMSDASVVTRLAEGFVSHGVDFRRVECLGWSDHASLLAEYGRTDLALDSLPFNGGLTTCEALWMGVPVITCPGETFASRHSLSHLSNIGLTETIARDDQEYVGLAVALAGDLPRLARLRAGLRDRMAASPLCDGKRFAANLTAILRDVWREWCRQI